MNTGRQIEIHTNKTLSLENALVKDIVIFNAEVEGSEDSDVMLPDVIAEKMRNEIIFSGATPVGPLIQRTWTSADKGALIISLLLQADRYIDDVNPIYRMEPLIKVSNCLYTRFNGFQDDIKYAYQKLEVVAYEENIKINGNSYIVFLGPKDDGTITTDIFMEREEG